MKNRVRIALVLMVGFGVMTQSCEKTGEENNKTKISEYNDDESHKAGDNCMNCHVSGGEGEGWFNVAGTVYDESLASALPGSTVEFYTEASAGGTMKYSVEVDKRGNFYTTEDIDFGTGLFVSVKGDEGSKHMMSAVSSGACSSCHGNTTGKIWTK